MPMTKEQIDELLKKPLEDRKVIAFADTTPSPVTVIAWRDDRQEAVVGCHGDFSPGNNVGIWLCSCLSPVELPKPPKPDLKPINVTRIDLGGGNVACEISIRGQQHPDELRRITVDPNALTADDLEEHGITIHRVAPERESPYWFINHKDVIFGSRYDTEAAARLAATEWLRKEGKIE